MLEYTQSGNGADSVESGQKMALESVYRPRPGNERIRQEGVQA
jgi:hypothetical protein